MKPTHYEIDTQYPLPNVSRCGITMTEKVKMSGWWANVTCRKCLALRMAKNASDWYRKVNERLGAKFRRAA